jgi:RNA polymerase sigma factor (sigma-70 family)
MNKSQQPPETLPKKSEFFPVSSKILGNILIGGASYKRTGWKTEQSEQGLMPGKLVSCGLIWDFAVSKSVDESQRWVLSVMQRHGQELVTILWRILGSEQDVCDAYQDTFLQLAYHEDLKKPKHVKAYIFRTASHIAISMLRHRLAEKRLSRTIADSKVAGSPLPGQGHHTSHVSSPANELDSKYLQETLRECISRLPDHLKNVVILRDLAELSYTRVGRILGISAATARVYRWKAIQLLAAWMNERREER